MRDIAVMTEIRDRVQRAEDEVRRKMKYGLPMDDSPGRRRGRSRGNPKPGDTIVTGGKKSMEW